MGKADSLTSRLNKLRRKINYWDNKNLTSNDTIESLEAKENGLFAGLTAGISGAFGTFLIAGAVKVDFSQFEPSSLLIPGLLSVAVGGVLGTLFGFGGYVIGQVLEARNDRIKNHLYWLKHDQKQCEIEQEQYSKRLSDIKEMSEDQLFELASKGELDLSEVTNAQLTQEICLMAVANDFKQIKYIPNEIYRDENFRKDLLQTINYAVNEDINNKRKEQLSEEKIIAREKYLYNWANWQIKLKEKDYSRYSKETKSIEKKKAKLESRLTSKEN